MGHSWVATLPTFKSKAGFTAVCVASEPPKRPQRVFIFRLLFLEEAINSTL